MKVEQSSVIKSASVISSEGGVIKPRIETPHAPRPPVAPKLAGSQPSYGIEQAVELLESLPQGSRNRDLVYQVVKTTLQSLHVEVAEIIADAQRKEGEFEAKLKGLDDQIAEFEAQIKAKRREAQGLRQQHLQIQQVRQQLEQADRRSERLPAQKPAKSKAEASSSSPAKGGGALHAVALLFSSLWAAIAKLGQAQARPTQVISQPRPREEAAAPAVASNPQPEPADAPAAPSQALAA